MPLLLPFAASSHARLALLAAGLSLLGPTVLPADPGADTAAGPAPRPLSLDGSRLEGTASPLRAGEFQLTLPEAGLLTVAVQATDDADLALNLVDEEGQPVTGGSIDADVDGHHGREYGVIALGAGGSYRLRVLVHGIGSAESTYQIAANWIALPSLAVTPDPGDRPSQAAAITPNQPAYGSIRPARNERRRWFMFDAPAAGHVAAITSAESGDLILDAFDDGAYEQVLASSDQDLRDNRAAEALLVPVVAGQRLYLRVSTYDPQEASDFRLLIHWLPE